MSPRGDLDVMVPAQSDVSDRRGPGTFNSHPVSQQGLQASGSPAFQIAFASGECAKLVHRITHLGGLHLSQLHPLKIR